MTYAAVAHAGDRRRVAGAMVTAARSAWILRRPLLSVSRFLLLSGVLAREDVKSEKAHGIR